MIFSVSKVAYVVRPIPAKRLIHIKEERAINGVQ